MQWVVLGVALAVIAATVLVVATGPSAGPGSAARRPASTTPLDERSDLDRPTRCLSHAIPPVPSSQPLSLSRQPPAPGSSCSSRSSLADPADRVLGSEPPCSTQQRDELLLEVDASGAHVPASTTKLLTALATLEALGPDSRFRTTVVADRRRDRPRRRW